MANNSPGRIAYRLISGRPLDGVARTDATYLRPATRALTPHGRASRWARLPGWKRQAARLGIPVAGCGAYAAWSAAPVVTAASATVLAGIAGAHGVRTLRRAWRTRRFRAVYIRPVLAALAPALGDASIRLHVDPELGSLMPRLARPMSPAEKAAREWYGERVEPVIRWAPDRVMRGAWALQKAAEPLTRHLVHLRVPREEVGPCVRLVFGTPYLTVEQRAHVTAVIKAKLPTGELQEAWDQVGEQVGVVWTVRKRPPKAVGYADLAARLDGLKEWEYFVGLGADRKPVVISLKDDSPHIACSAGSGAGKSVLAQLIAVQVLARGGRVVILDLKGSHRWALGMPGVDYCTTPAQMHAALLKLAALANERNTLALHEDEDWDPGERVFLIAEELNATMTQLRDYWSDVRQPGESKVSPGVKAFRNLLFMGRSAKINVFAVAQMLTANTTGGPESRENFGIRALARYTRNNWQMLVPEASMPRASRTLGRWQIVTGGTATEVQVCFLFAHEARLLVAKCSPVARTPLKADGQGFSQRAAPVGETADPLDERVTLRMVVDRKLVPWQYEATKKRLQKARKGEPPTAPAVVGKEGLADLFRLGDMIAWVESEMVR
jgi:hypothetical protein